MLMMLQKLCILVLVLMELMYVGLGRGLLNLQEKMLLSRSFEWDENVHLHSIVYTH